MTKEQFIAKYDQLVQEEVAKYLTEKAKTLAASGAIDWEKYEDNYLLPKMALSAALKSLSEEFVPFTREYRDDLANFARII